ncbi:MAG TPA: LysR family transcriptional regulator [Erythrobacter sp.]|nr:LysR family transcriptional regulator [Erythrobacter sp.]
MRRMQQPPPPQSPHSASARPDNSRWTGDKAAEFIKVLAGCGMVARAARSVGMSRQAAYRLRARAPQFAFLWDEAVKVAAARKAAARRGRGPVHPLLSRAPYPPEDRRDRPGRDG